jgi:hypothetical protein
MLLVNSGNACYSFRKNVITLLLSARLKVRIFQTTNFVIFTGHLVFLGNEITMLLWFGRVGRMGETRNRYRILVGEPLGKRSLARPRRGSEDNIKVDLREIGGGWKWIRIASNGEFCYERC